MDESLACSCDARRDSPSCIRAKERFERDLEIESGKKLHGGEHPSKDYAIIEVIENQGARSSRRML